ncbi:5'-methylthioadenosine phosphorylase (5- methylthioadenosine phosphorylase) (MTA phosphorylase) (MTAPase) [Desulforapulum autotrophicum HRM2]|uniref:Purine nucleoside phosphorylase n=1 Tax=Desulforapulum autotrophicum (strain ATCC 43914 / DSM 3382 / VKM B-1955 / HRM2) TaxID=177437 RepID=C0QHS5_DESAH|nr:S-methyl-5'-thioadenosine phosphorylase [Desulforapulum autotrophicum]ACN13633.1 5'-methylthioadenosine phosphorylase (5- methylthioadenosine phosphorylase) (MTA phosphorylase) (MTAPase) [Desulforapulum autotrophicum HRM2]
MVKVGIIGGSGMDDPEIVDDATRITVKTPYGDPSSPLTCGRIKGVEVVILARHGHGHCITPSQVNNRANIMALKDLGVTAILATTACGSLKQEIHRGDLVILDQFIDFTRLRKNTFHDSFENGMVHAPMADPFDPDLRQLLFDTAVAQKARVHQRGTVVTIEGPRFSTRAESKMFRLWGGDVINMSIAPEAALAREAAIPYGVVAMSTDYDCWNEDEAPVSWEEVLKVFNNNAERVKALLIAAVAALK